MHKVQTDYFAVIQGRMLFLLVYEDGRSEGKFVVDASEHKTLVIPPGVWHGYMALEPSIMVFYISHKYDPKDEFRRKCSPADWSL